jgi:hypothetical protein
MKYRNNRNDVFSNIEMNTEGEFLQKRYPDLVIANLDFYRILLNVPKRELNLFFESMAQLLLMICVP